MRLAKFIIRRFKGIDELECTMPNIEEGRHGSADFLTILGENNRCKSSVLEALRLAFPDTDIKKPSKEHFPNNDYSRGSIEVELHFDKLSTNEKNKQGIKYHLFGDSELRIKKTWTAKLKGAKKNDAKEQEIDTDTENVTIGLDVQALSASVSVPDEVLGTIEETGFEKCAEIHITWKPIIDNFLKDRIGSDSQPKQGKTRKPGPNTKQIEDFTKYAAIHARDLCQKGDYRWQSHPGGFNAIIDSTLPHVIFLPAIKEVHKDADPSTTNSTAQKLLSIMFEQRLAGDKRIVEYKKAMSQLESIFDQQDKSSPLIEIQNEISDKLKKLMASLTIELQFIAPALSETFSQSTTMKIADEGVKTNLINQGHGAQRAIFLTLLELYAQQLQKDSIDSSQSRGCLVLCEEPEIYLHPQMCRRMRDVLVEIARTGTAQVICTTHSPVFFDLADRHDGIVILSRDGNGDDRKVKKQPQATPNIDRIQDDYARLRMLLDFDPAVNELFFARRVILVEGDSEVAAFMSIVNMLARDSEKPDRELWNNLREICLVNCRGKDTIPAMQRVLNSFQVTYCVIHDRDGEDAASNQTIHDLLETRQAERLLVHVPNFDQRVFKQKISKPKPYRIHKIIQSKKIAEWSPALLNFFRFVVGEGLYSRLGLPKTKMRSDGHQQKQTLLDYTARSAEGPIRS